MLRSLSVLAEKTFWTFVEVFITSLLAAGSFGADGWTAAGIAAISAALTVIANGLGGVEIITDNAYLDIAFRTIRTWAVSFTGFLIAAPTFELSISAATAAAVAAVPSAISVLKSWTATKIGNKTTAALLPGKVDY